MFIPLYDHNRLRYLTRPYANYALIAITAACFLATGGFDQLAVENAAIGLGVIPSAIYDYETLPPEYVVVPEPATLLTYAFLHANWMHLGGNMLFLWVFGDNIEDALGRIRYVLFYLACAAAAGFVYAAADPQSPAPLIGASGAVAGVVGAYLVLHPRAKLWILALGRIPLKLSAAPVLAVWVAFQVVNIAIADPDETIAWWAHLGGLAAGATLVVVLRRRGVPLFDRQTPEPG